MPDLYATVADKLYLYTPLRPPLTEYAVEQVSAGWGNRTISAAAAGANPALFARDTTTGQLTLWTGDTANTIPAGASGQTPKVYPTTGPAPTAVHAISGADINTDGKPDLWAFTRTGVHAYLNTGADSFANPVSTFNLSPARPPTPWTAQAYIGARGTQFTDVDGDHRADAVAVNDDAIYVRRSTGTAFGTYQPWTAQPYYGTRGTHLTDVDGDNRADALVINGDAIYVRRSTGTAFGTYQPWTAQPYYGTRGTHLTDVDGDNRADAVAVNDAGITVAVACGANCQPSSDTASRKGSSSPSGTRPISTSASRAEPSRRGRRRRRTESG